MTNNNDNNVFVNLSYDILSKILNQLDNHLDRICCSLVCKKWFENKDKYFTFKKVIINRDKSQQNQDNNQITEFYTSKFHLNSYKSLFKQAIHSSTSLYQLEVYNDVNEYLDDVELTDLVGAVYFKRVDNKVFDQTFADRLASSKVESIEFIRCGKDLDFRIERMPENIKLLRLCGQDLKILPLAIESLMLSGSYDKPINLERYLSLTYFGIEDPLMKSHAPVKLPPNLRILECHSADIKFDNNIPSSLYKLKIRPNQINYFKSSKSINKIAYFVGPDDVAAGSVFSAADFPDGLERLSIYANDLTITKEMLPRHVKQLKIFGENTVELDAFILMDRVERIYITDIHNTGSLPTLPETVKKFVIPSNFDSGSIGKEIQLPNALEYLDLGTSYDQPLFPGSIPNTVTYIRLSQVYNQKIVVGSLPSNLESINFFMYSRRVKEGVIPKTTKSVCTTKSFYKKNSIQSLPSSVTSIEVALDFITYDIRRLNNENYLVIGTDAQGIYECGITHYTALDSLIRTSQEENFSAKAFRMMMGG